MNYPVCYILVGCPGSGKSTWRKNIIQAPEYSQVVISTDDYIDMKCKQAGITYSRGFKSFYDEAEEHMWALFNKCIKENQDIIIDRTNVTKKSRKKFLNRIPKTYKKYAIVFKRDLEYLLEVNNKRREEGKFIPENVIESMCSMFQEPTREEGFDKVIFKEYIEERDMLK